MNETNFRTAAIKSIAIIGFFATIVLIVWLVTESVKRAPGTFSSLATITESISNYRAVHELSIATEKTVVNSNESFQLSWTDVRQDGEYQFTYECVSGVDLFVRDGDGALTPVSCTDVLTLPATVHGLFLSVTSDDMRFIDIPLHISFTNKKNSETLTSQSKITVVNATIPTREEPVVVVQKTPAEVPVVATVPKAEPVKVATPVTSTPTKIVTPSIPRPALTTVYPTSNPNGVVDLSVKTLGSGIIKDGVFVYTAKYDRDLQNSVKFDIRNVGTKTSDAWAFITILPDGTIFKSAPQLGLKPNEHVEFTLGFRIDDDVRDDFVRVQNTVYTTNDVNEANNRSAWNVAVQD